MIIAIPENIVCVANVAINAGIPIVDTMKPLKIPINVDAAKEIITASHIFIPLFTIRYAAKIFTKEITEPVPRSISPSKITNVIPTDAIPQIDT